jgi:hypothetical protein
MYKASLKNPRTMGLTERWKSTGREHRHFCSGLELFPSIFVPRQVENIVLGCVDIERSNGTVIRSGSKFVAVEQCKTAT